MPYRGERSDSSKIAIVNNQAHCLIVHNRNHFDPVFEKYHRHRQHRHAHHHRDTVPVHEADKTQTSHHNKESRNRRETPHQQYTTWLLPAQRIHLNRRISQGASRDEIWGALVEYYEETSGKTRHTALANLYELCKMVDTTPYEKAADVDNPLKERRRREVNFDFPGYVKTHPKEASSLCIEVNSLYKVIKENILRSRHLKWLNEEELTFIEHLRKTGSDHWEVMARVATYFTTRNRKQKDEASVELKPFCVTQLTRLLGSDSYEEVSNLYLHSATVDHIVSKFTEIVAALPDEDKRMEAEHYGLFCKKVFRLTRYDPERLLAWLANDQRHQLASMMHDPEISDDDLYVKIIEFYENANEETQTEAKNVIDRGCKDFIDNMLGEENAEVIEEMRNDGVKPQTLSAHLMNLVADISDDRERQKMAKSLPICKRIYLGFLGECACHGHSSKCNPQTHACLDCTHNTAGFQCDRCAKGFQGNATHETCSPKLHRASSTQECNCNGHAETGCDRHGTCLECLHNTAGINCDRCAFGYYGDAQQGTPEDCTKCPCPEGIDCFINSRSLVQCRSCPEGRKGLNCQQKISENSTMDSEEFF
ncbi:hypothetical protein L596_012160 [Steinernema carpocapsae]|uniref:Laminin EGF-like domain-containing protein n=1 Tax=Steinernema carpocapsae TaxID=34508 RepID=A0A4U5NWV4_STECR|nr:hypothetical protein L596_012160 [Steinernema carpocapsae]